MRHRRAGFTMIELMIVVLIILIILAMSISAVFQVMSTWQNKQTEVTIRKLSSGLKQQWNARLQIANKEPLPQWAWSLAGGDSRRARVIYIKATQKRDFPMTFAEAMSPQTFPGGSLPANPTYVRYLQTAAAGHDEAAACLYMILTVSPGGATFVAEAGLGANHMLDRLGDGKNEVVDAWRRPLRFFRWPCGMSSHPGDFPVLPGPPSYDSADPDGMLLNWGGAFSQLFHPLFPGGSQRLEPVVVSAGPDGDFGLADYYMTPASPAEYDNIYSHRLIR